MKHVKVFEEFRHGDLTTEQVKWLNSVVEGTWKLSPEGRVDVNGSVNAAGRKDLKTFPVEFGKVTGNFDCSDCASLTTLQGSPSKVGSDFYCYRCHSLTTLQGSPSEVRGDFACSGCASLTTLQGSPSEVGGGFYCSGCPRLPPEELDLLELDKELFLKWANSGMKIQDFLHRNRGTLKGKKFGL